MQCPRARVGIVLPPNSSIPTMLTHITPKAPHNGTVPSPCSSKEMKYQKRFWNGNSIPQEVVKVLDPEREIQRVTLWKAHFLQHQPSAISMLHPLQYSLLIPSAISLPYPPQYSLPIATLCNIYQCRYPLQYQCLTFCNINVSPLLLPSYCTSLENMSLVWRFH